MMLAALIALVVTVATNQLTVTDAFHLSMVASRSPPKPFNLRGPPFAPLPSPFKPLPGSNSFPGSAFDITGGLISQLAIVALKLRLADHTDVSCDVTCSSTDLLLRGNVGPVTVKGKGWRSGRGLTCRAIEATVDSCELDVNRILTKRKLVLTTPASGKAMIALNAADFGNFITHPLMRPPSVAVDSSNTETIEFVKEDVRIDHATGTITFFTSFNGQKWECSLRRGLSAGERAIITVEPAVRTSVSERSHALAHLLQESLSTFFNHLVFELDGTFLSFRDMMVTNKGEAPSVMLALNILVRKFPSVGLDF